MLKGEGDAWKGEMEKMEGLGREERREGKEKERGKGRWD